MINYLARLGWASGDKEKFTIEELIHLFNLEKLNKSSSIFDYKKVKPVVLDLIENKLIKTKDNEIVIRKRGKMMLDYIARSLVDCF